MADTIHPTRGSCLLLCPRCRPSFLSTFLLLSFSSALRAVGSGTAVACCVVWRRARFGVRAFSALHFIVLLLVVLRTVLLASLFVLLLHFVVASSLSHRDHRVVKRSIDIQEVNAIGAHLITLVSECSIRLSRERFKNRNGIKRARRSSSHAFAFTYDRAERAVRS